MPIISEPELKIIISNSKRCKSHSEGSDIHLHEPVEAVFPGVQEQILGNFATNPPRSDELLEYPESISQRWGNSEILQRMKSTILKTSNQKHNTLAQQKQGGKQGRIHSSFYQQATS
ncbi:hypothetical protein O181_126977 [Austropuccinia psidii MF-1]|uniref:Uncharacterized protein n=1 Tax=Austropuccinia psidii MF-1 TaxID=1389203 RepID=A0A9Q3KUF5_9BASI|nr:hypothetical protein [Austropuccinia psidii MF-1]